MENEREDDDDDCDDDVDVDDDQIFGLIREERKNKNHAILD